MAIVLDGTTGITTPAISSTSPAGVASGGTGATTLTANNVLLGNGTSALQVIAPSTSGNVLTSTGTTWASSTPVAGALVFLSTVTASASATVDIETTFNSTYDNYLLIIAGLVNATNLAALNCLLKVGGAYAGANYAYMCGRPSSNATTWAADIANSAASLIQIAHSLQDGSGVGHGFHVYIRNPASTTLIKRIRWDGDYITGGNITRALGVGENTAVTALTGIRFQMSSGNINAGTFRLYGIANS